MNYIDSFQLSRDRYYELRHFCLQYPTWKQEYEKGIDSSKCSDGDPTAEVAIQRADYASAMQLIEFVAHNTSFAIGDDILRYVIGLGSYDTIQPRCTRDEFFYYVHKFFWLLDKEKGL